MNVMKMFGSELHSMQDLKKNFSIDELIYSYYSGELAVFLDGIGECEILQKLDNIKHNGYLLTELYKLFGLNPETLEEDIRNSYLKVLIADIFCILNLLTGYHKIILKDTGGIILWKIKSAKEYATTVYSVA